jgi:hypothetical protein
MDWTPSAAGTGLQRLHPKKSGLLLRLGTSLERLDIRYPRECDGRCGSMVLNTLR